MKTLYLDCFAGISGDMFLGALLDLGVSLEALQNKLSSLSFLEFDITAKKTTKNGISCTKIDVHELKNQHVHRHLADIFTIIDTSDLSVHVKNTAKQVFHNLAQAEAHIHNCSIDSVHFHEVGAIDSIVDILGVLCALELLEIEKIICSPLALGKGTVKCAHGIIPLPAPATCELLKGIPCINTDIVGETVTPTGAVLVKSLCETFGDMPSMNVSTIGYGAGTADRPVPNVVRAFLGTTNGEDVCVNDKVKIIETNIDDMNPEFFEYVITMLLNHGALDTYITPIIMKKGRPAHLLTCLTRESNLQEMVNIILKNTTSIGVRILDCNRFILKREIVTVETKYGPIRVKVARDPETDIVFNLAPEWEDCKMAATDSGITVKLIYDNAKEAAYHRFSS